MSQILPRFYARQNETARLQRIAQIVLEAGPAEAPRTVARATLAGDARRLRGIPVCAYGVAGTAPGTDPAAYVVRRSAA